MADSARYKHSGETQRSSARLAPGSINQSVPPSDLATIGTSLFCPKCKATLVPPSSPSESQTCWNCGALVAQEGKDKQEASRDSTTPGKEETKLAFQIVVREQTTTASLSGYAVRIQPVASETKPTRKATSKQRPERVRAIEGDTNEYGTVYDKPGGHITGFWFPSDEWATDSMRSVTLGIMLIKHGADEALRIDAAVGHYRIVPNRYDNRGGCFVMLGTNRCQANFCCQRSWALAV